MRVLPLLFAYLAIVAGCSIYGAIIIDTSGAPPLDWGNANHRAAGLLLFGGGGLMGLAVAALAALQLTKSD